MTAAIDWAAAWVWPETAANQQRPSARDFPLWAKTKEFVRSQDHPKGTSGEVKQRLEVC